MYKTKLLVIIFSFATLFTKGFDGIGLTCLRLKVSKLSYSIKHVLCLGLNGKVALEWVNKSKVNLNEIATSLFF